VSLKSPIGLLCLSIMTLVCPASNGEQASNREGRTQAYTAGVKSRDDW